jgi:hypothetical protein
MVPQACCQPRRQRNLKAMEVHFAPELQAKIDQLVVDSGCPVEELIGYAMEAYIADLAQAREMLESRYDDLKSGKVKPVDGEAFFESLRQREEELLKNP